MKRLVRKFINKGLSPFDLKIMRDPNEITSADDLFDDLRKIINNDSPVCLDVGANEGQTIESLLMVFTKPVIHSFEPSSKIFKILKKKEISGQVFVYNSALGRKMQSQEFFNYNNSVLSSFLPLDSNKENRFRSVELDRVEIVEVDTVDAFLERKSIDHVDLLKIDTQGFDMEVLKGAKDALQNGVIQNVLIEMNFVKMYEGQSSPEKIINFLKEKDILLIDFYEKARQNYTLAWCTALFGRR